MTKHQNKIEKLISKLCPEGVEFKELGEVCDFKYGKGNTIPKTGGEYPVYGCNGIVGTHRLFNNEDSPIIGHIGTAGIVVWGKGKHFVTYNGTICKPKNTTLLSKYLYYNLIILNLPNLTKGSQPFLSYDTIKELRIPIPPVPIQQEIVKILDSFTELESKLEAELETELQAREKQYQYYRNALLTYEESVHVKYLALSKIIDYEQPTKYIVKRTDYSNDYITPVLTAGKSFILGYTNEIDGIFNASKEKPVIIFDDFTTSNHWVDFNFKVKSSAMKMLKFKEELEILFRYTFYAMQCIRYAPKDHTRQWISKYSKIKIAVPTLTEQERIINILDRYNSLVNDISVGLLAEISARKSQYEFYRNKILTFKEYAK